VKRRIVELMSVPLVQGSLRYAYKVGVQQGNSKARAEGAVFAAAILPRIAACDSSAANVISTNMAYPGARTTPMAAGFPAVKTAFESVYACLGITCADVGGLESGESAGAYYPDAGPCTEATTTQAPATATTASGGSIARFLPIIMVLPLLLQ